MKTWFRDSDHSYWVDHEDGTKPYRLPGATTIGSVYNSKSKNPYNGKEGRKMDSLMRWAVNMAVDFMRAAQDEGMMFTDELFADAKKAHTKKKDKASEHGKDYHSLVEEYIKECIASHKAAPFDPGKKDDPIRPFIEWALRDVEYFLFTERVMANVSDGYAGTADFAYVDKKGKRIMGDFKTSSGVHGVDYWIQVTCYVMLAEHEGDEKYDGLKITRLGKDGVWEERDVGKPEDLAILREAFLSCLTLYKSEISLKHLI